jgi:hypothetical protein
MAQLFIGQLPFSKFFPNDLLDLFRPYGNVVAHQLHIRQGNAFVTYATTDEADAAIRALHGQCALGTRSQPIQVMYSKGTRLISPFGLQHRSRCLARNKDRQRSKELMNGISSNTNNDSVSLNDGAAPGASDTQRPEYPSMLSSTGAEEVSTDGNGNDAGVASFASRGPSDIFLDEESRQVLSNGLFSNVSLQALNASATFQMQQQQQQAYMPSLIGVDPGLYSSTMKWTTAPPSVMMASTATVGHASNGSGVPSTPSRLSSPAAPPPPPPAFSYVVMQPAAPNMSNGYGMPPGVPVCYVMPASAALTYLPQQMQQQGLGSVMTPFGAATVVSSPMSSVQMCPM